jgi:hypothetical protein
MSIACQKQPLNDGAHPYTTFGMASYRGQCDYFAVYCEEFDKIYLIPVDQVGTTGAVLRLTPRKNNQDKNILWAKDYEL